MTCDDNPGAVLAWSDGELYQMFRHHNGRLILASLAAVVVGTTGIVLLLRGQYDWAAGAALLQLANAGAMLWHRARTSLLTKLRFRNDEP